jgi:hypothetical protein
LIFQKKYVIIILQKKKKKRRFQQIYKKCAFDLGLKMLFLSRLDL